ncbi:MAG: hypothetical protein ACKO5E_02280 [bacterium]
MNQRNINSAVARATGENMRSIRRMGFTIADPSVVKHDPEPPIVYARTIDWDDFYRRQTGAINLQRPRKRLA